MEGLTVMTAAALRIILRSNQPTSLRSNLDFAFRSDSNSWQS